MIIHDYKFDDRGGGRWEVNTTRYVPMNGGSRSRLPIRHPGYEDIRRYYGAVGMSEGLAEKISTMAELYRYLGGGIMVTAQTEAYIGRLVEQSKKWMQGAVQPAGQ